MKILVTGGAGFIGRNLVSRLLSDGHEVTIYDNFSSSKKEPVGAAKIIEGDIRDADDVARAMKGSNTVFHLAAIKEIRNVDEDLIYNTNFIGSKVVFEAAKEQGAKVVFASSAAVYGEAKLCREADECRPTNQYGKSKLKAEKLCGGFVARLFNVYGPNGHGVVNTFCRLIPKYEPVTVYGHGTQTRDFIYIDDVVNALVTGLQLEGVYNVGTGKETSVLEVADMVHEMTKAKPDIKFTAPFPGEVMRSKADISKIQQTEWFPKTELGDGIRKILISEGFDFSVVESLK